MVIMCKSKQTKCGSVVFRKIVATISILLITLLSLPVPRVFSQSSGKFIIHQVDISAFPDVCVWATAMDSTGAGLPDLQPEGFILKEDNGGKEISSVTYIRSWLTTCYNRRR